MTDETPDLDALVQAARIAAAQRRSMDTAAAEVIRILAEADGSMPLDDLLSAGAPRDVVAYLVAEDATDRRRKQRAHLGFIGRAAVVWLSTTGWQAAGFTRRAGTPPTAQTLQHAMAPAQLRQWLDQRAGALTGQGITVRCVQGAACRRWSADLTASAWGALRVTADPDGLLGSLTGGLIPDALVVERFPPGDRGRQLHQRLRGTKPPSDDDLAETTYAVEIEDSRKAAEPLRGKVDRLEAACERLQAAHAVLWIVRTREVADRLRDLGVDSDRRPTQLLVAGRDVGLGGEDLGTVRHPWYMTRVPPDA